MRISRHLLPLFLLTTTTAQRLLDNNSQCHIAAFIPFTDARNGLPDLIDGDDSLVRPPSYGYGYWPDAESLAKAAYSYLATAEMARIHFNERNAVLVPELKELLGDCPVTLYTQNPSNFEEQWYFDSAYTRKIPVEELLQIRANQQQQLCAVIGPVSPRAHEGISVVTESLNIPQIAYATTDDRLDNQVDYPNFVRALPTGPAFARAVGKYVSRDVYQRKYIAIIYEQSGYGEMYEDPLESQEDELDFESITEGFKEHETETLYDAFGDVVEKGFRTVVLVTPRPTMLQRVAVIAEELGLLGDGYLWLINADAIPPAYWETMEYPVDSPMDKMLRGAALFTNYDRFVYHGEQDAFLKAWREQSPELVKRLNTIVQPKNEDGEAYYKADPATYFSDETPAEFSSFVYDSVMLAGIGACRALNNETESHKQAILRAEFQGASGPVAFEPDTSNRDVSGVEFGVYNIRPSSGVRVDEETGITHQRYQLVLTHLYNHDNLYTAEDGSTQPGAWKAVDGVAFEYFDGSKEEPMPLRSVFDYHYLPHSMQIAGLILASAAVLICLGASFWLYWNRTLRLLVVSQCTFLHLLCLGAALVASSLYWISFDEGSGWSQRQLSIGCAAFSWFFVIGYLLMYCALFSKLWRLSKLIEAQQTVQYQAVLLPFSIIILASVAVLVVWQVLDPLTWQRSVIREEPLETYGECASVNYGVLRFIIPLTLLFVAVMILTSVYAYKLRNVKSDLTDCGWIFLGILTHIQTWAVGIPIVVITNQVSKGASYLMYVALAFCLSVSLVLLVIGPKVYEWFRDKYLGGAPKRALRLSVASPSQPRITGIATSTAAESTTNFNQSYSTLPIGSKNNTASSSSAAYDQQRAAELERQVRLLKMSIMAAEDSMASYSHRSAGKQDLSHQDHSSSTNVVDKMLKESKEEAEEAPPAPSQVQATSSGQSASRPPGEATEAQPQ